MFELYVLMRLEAYAPDCRDQLFQLKTINTHILDGLRVN